MRDLGWPGQGCSPRAARPVGSMENAGMRRAGRVIPGSWASPVTWVEASPRPGVPSHTGCLTPSPARLPQPRPHCTEWGLLDEGWLRTLAACPACRPTSPSLGGSCPHQHNQCAAWRIPQEPRVSQADGGTEARARQHISITSPFSGRAKLITVFFTQ